MSEGTWTVTFRGGPAIWANVLSTLQASLRAYPNSPGMATCVYRMEEADAKFEPDENDSDRPE